MHGTSYGKEKRLSHIWTITTEELRERRFASDGEVWIARGFHHHRKFPSQLGSDGL
jgi:hypothetical protein